MISVFSQTTEALLFMATLSCLWFAMSGAVRELIVDRPVWRRERRIGVGAAAYLGSNALVLGAVRAIQAAAMLGALYLAIGMGAAGVDAAELLLTGVLSAWAEVRPPARAASLLIAQRQAPVPPPRSSAGPSSPPSPPSSSPPPLPSSGGGTGTWGRLRTGAPWPSPPRSC